MLQEYQDGKNLAKERSFLQKQTGHHSHMSQPLYIMLLLPWHESQLGISLILEFSVSLNSDDADLKK